MSLKFEWDDHKATSNYSKHGVSFEKAELVFRDAGAIETLDDRDDYGEDRMIRTGMASGQLITVVFTERDDIYRIISARPATRVEHDDYYIENSQN